MWNLTHPSRDVPGSTPVNLINGKTQFVAGDCATCHASPAAQGDATRMGGGRELKTKFGTFRTPNISPDRTDGIGAWTAEQFIRAMREGVSPHGDNLYPAFPYTSYQRMSADDLRDMFAYIKTLSPVAGKAREHDLHFPWSIRRGVGVWRMAFLDGKPLPPVEQASAQWLRGRYLVEGPAHCAECHSPRNPMGAINGSKRFSGGLDPEGKGYFPNITPDETGIGYWSVNEIARYLKHGISPIGIKAGGDMKEVIANTSQLSDEDRLAMATYLKSLPPVDSPKPGMPEPNRTDEVIMLPTRNAAAAQSQLTSLGATRERIADAKVLYAVASTPFSLARPAQGVSADDGKLLGAARATVISREQDAVRVRIEGWQQEGAEGALYAQQGQRIFVAALAPAAIAELKRTKTVQDDATQANWHQVTLDVWVKPDGLSDDLQQVWHYNSQLFASTCAACHALPQPDHFLANQWIGNLKAMKRFTSLDSDQYRLLLAWLQYHSKDVGPSAEADGGSKS